MTAGLCLQHRLFLNAPVVSCDQENCNLVDMDSTTRESRTRCRLAIYSSQKDYDGHSLAYTAFVFPHASGSPASVKFKDGEFFAPSYTMKSRPSKSTSPMTVLSLPSLPVIVSQPDDLPDSPVSGQTVILAAASGIAGLDESITAGTYAVYRNSAYTAI